MSPEELKKLIEDLKADNLSNEDIAKACVQMFVEGTIDLGDLKTFLAAVGFDLKPEVLKQLEESPESFQVDEKSQKSEEKKEESKPEDNKSDKPEEKSEDKKEEKSEEKKDDKEDEESEWKEAKKYFHFNK